MTKRMMVAAALVLTLLSGCALTSEQINIEYQRQLGVGALPGAEQVAVTVQVVDKRSDKSRVSCKKNGFGMEMAPIVASEDVAVTLKRALEQELSARGFRVESAATLVQVTANLLRFYNDHKVGIFSGDAIADLNLTVTVRGKSGKDLYSGNIDVQGMEKNTMLMTGENARLALNRALENGMRRLFDDQAFITALLGAAQ